MYERDGRTDTHCVTAKAALSIIIIIIMWLVLWWTLPFLRALLIEIT